MRLGSRRLARAQSYVSGVVPATLRTTKSRLRKGTAVTHASGLVGEVEQDARPAELPKGNREYRRASEAQRTTVSIRWTDHATEVMHEPFTVDESLASGRISAEAASPVYPLAHSMAVSFGAVGGACARKEGLKLVLQPDAEAGEQLSYGVLLVDGTLEEPAFAPSSEGAAVGGRPGAVTITLGHVGTLRDAANGGVRQFELRGGKGERLDASAPPPVLLRVNVREAIVLDGLDAAIEADGVPTAGTHGHILDVLTFRGLGGARFLSGER